MHTFNKLSCTSFRSIKIILENRCSNSYFMIGLLDRFLIKIRSQFLKLWIFFSHNKYRKRSTNVHIVYWDNILWIYIPYETKFNINLYNLMRSTRISIDRLYWFSPVDNWVQIRRKLVYFALFSDFGLNYLQGYIVKFGYQ